MPGSKSNPEDYRYGFNGMEKEDGLTGTTSHYDFGARIYDSRVGRFLSTDFLAKKYPQYSSYNFAGNSPIIAIDVAGDSIWVVIGDVERGRSGQLQVINELHVTIKVLDVSKRGYTDAEHREIAASIQGELNSELNYTQSANFNDPKTGKPEDGVMRYKAKVNVEYVTSMSDVGTGDHLLVLMCKHILMFFLNLVLLMLLKLPFMNSVIALD
jgi:RHS repeat-associated protein